MSDLYDDSRDRREMDNLTVPSSTEGSLRSVLENHLTRLVEDHNSEIAARVHFIQTGEIVNEAIRPYCAFIRCGSPREAARSIQFTQQMAIDLNYVLHSVDEISQFTALSELTDAQFAMVYNRVLIELKNRRLPQYAGA
jgi:hypothetical protein